MFGGYGSKNFDISSQVNFYLGFLIDGEVHLRNTKLLGKKKYNVLNNMNFIFMLML